MSLEKGISRMGTALGVVVGTCLAFTAISACFLFGAFDYLKDQYKSEYFEEVLDPFAKYRVTYKEPTYAIKENAPSTITYIYIPNIGIGLLATSLTFLTGLYSVKGITGTINWIIRGFRE